MQTRIFLILSAILAIAAGVLGYLNKQTLEETRATLQSTRETLAATKATLKSTEKTLADTENSLKAEQAKVAELEQNLNKKESELTKANSDIASLNSQLAEKTATLASVQSDLDAVKAEMAKLPNASSIAELGQQLTDMQNRITSAEAENKVLGEKVASAEAKAADLTKELERRKNAILAKGLEGQILAVNQPWGFVVLSLGDKQGVVSNAEMVVMRDGARIGRVRISSVEHSSSIGDIVVSSLAQGQRVLPGDRVIYTGAN